MFSESQLCAEGERNLLKLDKGIVAPVVWKFEHRVWRRCIGSRIFLALGWPQLYPIHPDETP